ncbi:prepilin-type N-terminal cleavage/methylation domain-containing protein [Persephonella sp.]
MRSNKGFTLIEVLVASVILFLCVVTVNAAFKQYATYKTRQERYERLYMSVISLVNEIEGMGLRRFAGREGEINGFKYRVEVKPVAVERNYVYSAVGTRSGNVGKYIMALYRVKITIGAHHFIFYRTEHYLRR